jgi:hypothetical protein
MKKEATMKPEIMFVACDENIINTAQSNQEWNLTLADTDEEAIEKFHSRTYDIVVFGNSMEEGSKNKLRKLFPFQQDELIIISDVTTEDVNKEITEAIEIRNTQRKPKITYKDNTLAYAKININFS